MNNYRFKINNMTTKQLRNALILYFLHATLLSWWVEVHLRGDMVEWLTRLMMTLGTLVVLLQLLIVIVGFKEHSNG